MPQYAAAEPLDQQSTQGPRDPALCWHMFECGGISSLSEAFPHVLCLAWMHPQEALLFVGAEALVSSGSGTVGRLPQHWPPLTTDHDDRVYSGSSLWSIANATWSVASSRSKSTSKWSRCQRQCHAVPCRTALQRSLPKTKFHSLQSQGYCPSKSFQEVPLSLNEARNFRFGESYDVDGLNCKQAIPSTQPRARRAGSEGSRKATPLLSGFDMHSSRPM